MIPLLLLHEKYINMDFLLVYIFPEAYSEPCHTSEMKNFAKIVNSFKPLTIFAKRSTLDV